MTADRDRRVLAEIERELRATDPELCDRLGRLEHRPGPLARLVSTGAITAWLAALVVALLLGLSGPALLFAAVAFTAVVVRLAGPDVGVPESTRHHHPPPFGLPPGWLR